MKNVYFSGLIPAPVITAVELSAVPDTRLEIPLPDGYTKATTSDDETLTADLDLENKTITLQTGAEAAAGDAETLTLTGIGYEDCIITVNFV